MLNEWKSKRDRDQTNGERERALIEYADFSDYIQIIERRDNWREVFSTSFGHLESVQESFRRLQPVRICTMHARIITPDDTLILYIEVKRIQKAISTFLQ